jgi:hypothetical protein
MSAIKCEVSIMLVIPVNLFLIVLIAYQGNYEPNSLSAIADVC